MSGLLTTRQVQNLLQIDRTTVYRMLKDGRLTGVKLGKQWRFSKSEIDDLLAYSPAATEPSPALSISILPLTCLQGMQNVSAEAIGIGAVTTDTTGKPLTQMSNPLRFCQLIRSSEKGRAACQKSLSQSAQRAGSLVPQMVCHAGLQCISSPVTINGKETAVFIAGQYYDSPPQSNHQRHIQQLAEAYDLDAAALIDAADEIPVLDLAKQQKIATWLPKLTHTLSEIGQERADLLGRLQSIAAMSAVGQGRMNHDE